MTNYVLMVTHDYWCLVIISLLKRGDQADKYNIKPHRFIKQTPIVKTEKGI